LAAGFLRVPAGRFMLITGIAAFGWTFMVLLFTQKFGSQVANWLMHFKVSGLALVCSGLGAIYLINRVRGAARKHDLVGKAMSNIERWRHWEFWPAWLFYPPVVFYCGWLALKYRGLTVPTAANPGIFSGGMVGESKMATLRELSLTSGEFTAAAKLVGGDTFTTRVLSFNEIRAQLDLDFPLILKPDIGQRGAGVKLIRSEDQAHAYFRQTDAPLIVQRYASGPNEVGIFYYRFPNETKGHIFKITVKNFPKITGDGVSKLSELIDCDSRAGLISKTYRQRFADRLGDVLKVGQELKLVEAGNHAQGCIFLDGEYLRTPELEARIDSISANLTGFFIGRYDICELDENSRLLSLTGPPPRPPASMTPAIRFLKPIAHSSSNGI
jgi:hypothetical protein